MKNKIFIIGNGGIAKDENDNDLANPDVGNFISSLKENGFDVFYASQKSSFIMNKFLYTYKLKDNFIDYKVIRGGKRNPLRYWDLLYLIYKILTYRNIYIYYPGGLSITSARICVLFGKKYGVYVRGYGIYSRDKSNSKHLSEEFTNWFILLKAAYLITVSEKLRNDLLPFNKKVSIIRPMIKWDLRDAVYSEKNYSNKIKWNFLCVGSIHERKGIPELIKVAEILEKENLNFSINVLGDGPLLNSLIENQKNGKVSKSLNFLGGVSTEPEISLWYERSDALLLFTRNEGFPRVLYEAMIKKLPIFTTFVSGISGTMKAGYNCIELPVRDSEGQVKAILDTICNPRLLNKIADNGLLTVKEIINNRLSHHEVLITNLTSLS
ncbi:MAG: glycosyltransferase family 4 protein [Bacteroidales bacterium]|nr:glycosyltransferase family 4 protein [Bacteroidales bacterium]